MASSSSRTNDSIVGMASSAAKLVVTSAILVENKRKRRSRGKLSPFSDDSSVKSLVAIDEGEEIVDFNFKNNRHPRVAVVRSRSPSPEPRVPVKEIVLKIEGSIEASKRATDLNDAIAQLRTRNKRYRQHSNASSVLSDTDSKTTNSSSLSNNSVSHEQVEFYLPQLGMDKNGKIAVDQTLNDPTALVNILRPWQVDFLESRGIVTAKQFLKAKRRRDLAKDMKKWRKRNGLAYIKSQSRKVAIHVWASTCEAVIRDVNEQRTKGSDVLVKPKILQRSISTESLCGTIATVASDASMVSEISMNRPLLVVHS